jgi:chromate transport protein ChrA
MRLTPIRLVIGLAFLGSIAFIAYAILLVRDASQIPMLSAAFAVLGLATAAIALAAVIELWRAAAAGRNGRALALAIVGGIVGLGAIGCFTAMVVLALLWRSA